MSQPFAEIEYIGDMVGADVDRDLLLVAIAAADENVPVTVEEGDITASFEEEVIRIEDADGDVVEAVALNVPASVDDIGLVTYLSRALASIDEDQLVVTDDGSFTIAGTATVTDDGEFDATVDGAVGVENSGGTQVDPAENVDGASSTAAVTDTSNAAIEVPDGRTAVTVMGEASGGPMSVTVEVSNDGTNWFEVTSMFSSDVSDGDAEAESFETGADHVRASGDANVARVEVAAKGA